MTYVEIAILIIIGVAAFLIALYHGMNAWVHHALKPRFGIIARDILVTNMWAEFPTEKPAKLPGQRQHIYLSVPGYKFDWQDETLDIRLSDGTIVHPEIQVVDEFGNIYETEDGARWGNTIGLSLKPTAADNTCITENRQNVTVRIQSAESFKCSAIGWINKRMK